MAQQPKVTYISPQVLVSGPSLGQSSRQGLVCPPFVGHRQWPNLGVVTPTTPCAPCSPRSAAATMQQQQESQQISVTSARKATEEASPRKKLQGASSDGEASPCRQAQAQAQVLGPQPSLEAQLPVPAQVLAGETASWLPAQACLGDTEASQGQVQVALAGEDSPSREREREREVGADSPRRARSTGLRGRRPSEGRPLQRSYVDLYEEAFSRKERRHTRQEDAEQALEREAKQRLEDFAQGMKDRRRLFKAKEKDTRTHLEREAELLRRREETKKKKEAEKHVQESEELRECTFQPKVYRHRDPRKRSPSPGLTLRMESFDQVGLLGKLRKLAERQKVATAALRLVAADEAQLKEDLKTMQTALHERFQQEETRRVVEMLRSNDSSSSTHGELIRKVQAAAAAGSDPTIVQTLIAELVGTSNQEIQARTCEALEPKRLEAESELYERRLVLVRELEAVEHEAMELAPGASPQERVAEAGVELGLAEHALRSLPVRPSATSANAHEKDKGLPSPSARALGHSPSTASESMRAFVASPGPASPSPSSPCPFPSPLPSPAASPMATTAASPLAASAVGSPSLSLSPEAKVSPQPQPLPQQAASAQLPAMQPLAQAKAQTPRSPNSECSPLAIPVAEADAAQPVRRRLEFMPHEHLTLCSPGAGGARLEQRGSSPVIVYRVYR